MIHNFVILIFFKRYMKLIVQHARHTSRYGLR
jgi:hypothetical protein